MTRHIGKALQIKPGDRYTSPFMDTMSLPEDDPTNSGFHTPIVHNEAWYILHEKLTQSRYDPIRDTDGFRAVADELTHMAK